MNKNSRNTKIARKTLKFIDLFCGAGGFTEGLRLAGLIPVLGIDHWYPATTTYQKNQGVKALTLDILELSQDLDAIADLPNVEVIVGSPPCVSFSNSNKSGYADKSLGLRLTEAFFRIVAVKKLQPNSNLRGWMMENVPKAHKHIQLNYSFRDLALAEWAKKNGFNPKDTAIDLSGKEYVVDSSIFGAPQRRKRLFIAELDGASIDIKPIPKSTPPTLFEVFRHIPKPSLKVKRGEITDPNFPTLTIPRGQLTDHFYDTGIKYRFWRESQFLKTNHPYMGKMSFPENPDNPARTVVASPFPKSRESMIFKCELNRRGDGEYRTPTVREAAILMTFPINYQFFGTEGQKWKLVGNAVCPMTASKIGSTILKQAGMSLPRKTSFGYVDISERFQNLNGRPNTSLENNAYRKKGARFRRHAFKVGNMTIALSNYDMSKSKSNVGSWRVFATYGISTSHLIDNLNVNIAGSIKEAIKNHSDVGSHLMLDDLVAKCLKHIPACPSSLQSNYESGSDFIDKANPVTFVESVRETVAQKVNGELIDVSKLPVIRKEKIPLRQAVTAYIFLKAVEHLEQGGKNE